MHILFRNKKLHVNYHIIETIEAGISLIISGVLVTSVYNFIEFLKGASTSDNAIRYLNGIDYIDEY